MRIGRFLLASALAFFSSMPALAQYAQPAAKVHRIGYLSHGVPSPLAALRGGLKELGYVEGENLVIDARFAENRPERLPDLAEELLSAKCDVIVTGSAPSTLAVKKATSSVPIVFAGLGDPVAAGIVASISQPNGNITGVLLGPGNLGYAAQWVDLLNEAVPGLKQVAVLYAPSSPIAGTLMKQVETAARASNVRVEFIDASNAQAMDAAFTVIAASGAQAMIVVPEPFFFASRAKIAQFAMARRLASVSFANVLAEAGGLMSYGANVDASNRRAARQVDRILKGAKPEEIAIEAMPLELVINNKAAREMGLTVPESLLKKADRVID